jgi:hypothetical protein
VHGLNDAKCIYIMNQRSRSWDVRCGMFDVGCGMCDVGCAMCDVGCAMCDVRCAKRVFSILKEHEINNHY